MRSRLFGVGLRHWLQLALTDGIGPILARRVIDAAGGAEGACQASARLLQQVEGIGSGKSARIAAALRDAATAVDSELDRAARENITLLCPDDDRYPVMLKSIPDPPLVLYVKGNLEPRDLHAIAIVGSRRCSFYGREQAERFGALLAGIGMTVISGGARGIDSAAHRGALSHPQGRTLAVLGCGVDIAYPPENDKLFAQIAARGAVISEFPFSTPPTPENFPRRNRIVSGLSRGVFVIEADIKSGALITARQAADDHNRPVFALPGRVDNATSNGPHQLIRDGAILVRGLEDILEGLGPMPLEALEAPEPTLFSDGAETAAQTSREEVADPNTRPLRSQDPARSLDGVELTDRQRLILMQMGSEAVSVDTIIERTALPAQVVLQELTYLSLKGVVHRLDGQTFARRG